MSIEEFSNISKQKTLDLFINFMFSVSAILLSLYFQVKFFKFIEIGFSKATFFYIIFLYFIFIALLLLGIYGIIVLVKPLKISFFNNNLNKEENAELVKKLYLDLKGSDLKISENLLQITYQKNYWSYKHKILFYIDNNILAIYTQNISPNPKGAFLDFGTSSRIQNKILTDLSKKFSC